ncbi:MAG: hydroxymethylglutaryl-CoA lyase [Betaproteobacteria bacterium]|nr:hydroxymethylglutaryl-CoA lyase [Betaproteobacteria bacterium]
MAAQRIRVNEVGVRDGFQIEREFIPTETKIALIDRLSETGLAKIEVTSFVHPKFVPNMADAETVLAQIQRVPGVIYAALVPNLKGMDRVLVCHRSRVFVDEINIFMSASETHNRANVNSSCEDSFVDFKAMINIAKGAGMKVNGTISTSFGCPFEGPVPEARVMAFAERYIKLGVDGITFADTTGMANPRQVESLMSEAVINFAAHVDITLHFHNTRGMGLANVLAGVRAGVTSFDASIAGLGGCPFAPGATGNVCTEDVVNMLADMGYDTGVDLDRLLAQAVKIPAIVGHEVPGQVVKAGKTMHLHPVPEKLYTQ